MQTDKKLITPITYMTQSWPIKIADVTLEALLARCYETFLSRHSRRLVPHWPVTTIIYFALYEKFTPGPRDRCT